MSKHLWLGLSLLLCGCGGGKQPVDGQVVFSGGEPAKELQGYMVTFDSKEQKLSAVGLIRADGKFHMGTHSTDDGVVLGKHRVSIFAPGSGDATGSNMPILPKYARFDTSELEVTINRGRNTVTLEVERNKKAKKPLILDGTDPRSKL